jgi:HEAT repeat protein
VFSQLIAKSIAMKTYQEIRSLLSEIEPDEKLYSHITNEDVPNLKMLLKESEAWLSARAIFALSHLENEEVYSIIDKATKDDRAAVRVAIAVASTLLPRSFADKILNILLDDKDPDVKHWAIHSIPVQTNDEIKTRLQKLSIHDSSDYIRSISLNKLANMKSTNSTPGKL